MLLCYHDLEGGSMGKVGWGVTLAGVVLRDGVFLYKIYYHAV